MGKIWIPGGGGGGVSSDDISLVRANVPNTLTALTRDSDDEIVTGSFDAETNTDDSLVREGKTYVKFNPETKLFEKRTGTEPERTGTYAKNVQWYDSNATALFQGESGHYGSSNANGDYDIRLSAGAAASGLGITSDKIMAGKSIGPVNGAATNDANLVPDAILSGYSGYSKGAKVAGTMVDWGNWGSSELSAGASVTIPLGRHVGGGKVTAKSLASQTACSASDGYVYSGKTYWKDGALRSGSMSVGSILSFSAAAYGGKKILLKWQNPYAATGRPFSGVAINYSTSGYPGSGGTQIYKGIGSNSASGGWSQVIVDMPASGTTYYFSLRSYASCSAGDMYSGASNAYATTQAEIWLSYTASGSYTIPTGYSKLDAFAVGGGGGTTHSGSTTLDQACQGAAGGCTDTIKNVSVSGGDTVNFVVGAGQTYAFKAERAGSSSVSINGSNILSVLGGGGVYTYDWFESYGGSGGGSKTDKGGEKYAGQGGADGNNGYLQSDISSTNTLMRSGGQGRTTRAWGSSSGTLYAGGGGGGSYSISTNAGSGGSGGGGNGGRSTTTNYPPSNGIANTGGGAGGGGRHAESKSVTASGGSGIVLLHVY